MNFHSIPISPGFASEKFFGKAKSGRNVISIDEIYLHHLIDKMNRNYRRMMKIKKKKQKKNVYRKS